MNTLQDVADRMRAAGVKRIKTTNEWPVVVKGLHDVTNVVMLTELELSDTIPAPPPAFETLDEEPEKPAGTCIALGCSEPGGWHFDTRYCGPHGRAAAGVKP